MRPLRTYDDWKYCITVLCGIGLTSGFVAHRLAELRNPRAYGTQRFVASWGEEHLKNVIGWFEQAEREIAR